MYNNFLILLLYKNMNNLIFLPGASGSTAFWHPLIEKLPQHYQTKIIGYRFWRYTTIP